VDIEIRNCNNIDFSQISLKEGVLNIKYAINGTGKTTISKALYYAITQNIDGMKKMTPFKYINDDTKKPSVTGIENIETIACFDEDYLRQYTFQQDELVKNSFEIFIKTEKYVQHLTEIDNLVSEIKTVFQTNEELNILQNVMSEFIKAFKATKSSHSTTGALGRGLAKGNKLEHIPEELESYKPFLKNENAIKWLQWQLSGKNFLEVSDCCPYCTSVEIRKNKEIVLKVGEEFEAKYIEYVNTMLDLFSKLTPYFTDSTNKEIEKISKGANALDEGQKNILFEINTQIIIFDNYLKKTKELGFNSFKNVDDIVAELGNYKINIEPLMHLKSSLSLEKVGVINEAIDKLLEKAGNLKGEIAQQKLLIAKNIREYQTEINDFLKYAGYHYNVFIEDDKAESYKLKLKHNDFDSAISNADKTLSFGERNAFALVLFMYDVIKNNQDLIVLDDPISSFDENKKFAILQMLFLKNKKSLKGKTVLLLTHDFGILIDAVYTLKKKFQATAFFLQNSNGNLSELIITKENIMSVKTIVETNIANLTENINKLIYLRRLFELNGEKDCAWQLLSNLFKKRDIPVFREGDGPDREMTIEEINNGTDLIKKYVPTFLYPNELGKVKNIQKSIELYNNSNSGYEKLQIYRIIKVNEATDDFDDNDVIKKFVNETYHIENDYLFQLNPCDYEIVPHYIIEECDKEIANITI
jgi:ABC-type dipeptide/oligopeptide/nickel transport system ATPase subunit